MTVTGVGCLVLQRCQYGNISDVWDSKCRNSSEGCKQRISCLNNRCNCTHPVTGGEEEVCCRYVDRFVVLRYVVWVVDDFKCCNCNLLLPCCVCALFLDLIMADVGLLNDQRILEWSRVGRDVGAVTMSVYVVRLHPPPRPPKLFLDTHSWKVGSFYTVLELWKWLYLL